MKKLILAAVLLLCFTAANAQLSWNVRAGVNLSGIENSDARQKFGLKVGGGADYAFSDLFALRSMLYFTAKGISLDNKKLGFFPDKSARLNYLELLPVMASFRFRLTECSSLALSAGPYFGYRISKSQVDSPIRYRSFDAGVNAGLDYNLGHFIIGAEAEYGFTSLSKQAAKLHNICYSLMLGYRF